MVRQIRNAQTKIAADRALRTARARGRWARGEQIRYARYYGTFPTGFSNGKVVGGSQDPRGFFIGKGNNQVTGLSETQALTGKKQIADKPLTDLEKFSIGFEKKQAKQTPPSRRSAIVIGKNNIVTSASKSVRDALGFDPVGKRLTERQAQLVTGGISGKVNKSQAQRIIINQARTARAKIEAQKLIDKKFNSGQTVTIGDVLKAVTGKSRGFTATEVATGLGQAAGIAKEVEKRKASRRAQEKINKELSKLRPKQPEKEKNKFGGTLISAEPEVKGLGAKISRAREQLIFDVSSGKDGQILRTLKGTVGLGALGVVGGVYDFGYMVLNPIESTKDMIDMAKNPIGTIKQLAFEFERDPAGSLAKFWTIHKLSKATSKATTAAGKKALPVLKKLNKVKILKAVPIKYRALVEAAISTTTKGRAGRIVFNPKTKSYSIITNSGRIVKVPKKLNVKFEKAAKIGTRNKKISLAIKKSRFGKLLKKAQESRRKSRIDPSKNKLKQVKKLGFDSVKEFNQFNRLSEQARRGSKIAKIRLDALESKIKKRIGKTKAKKKITKKKRPTKAKVSKIDRDIARLDKKILKLQELDKQKIKSLDNSAKKLGFKNYREQVKWNELSQIPNSKKFESLNKLIENRIKRLGKKSLKTAQAKLKRKRAISKLSNERFINNEIKKALKSLKKGTRTVKKATKKRVKKLSESAKKRVLDIERKQEIDKRARAIQDDLSNLQKSLSGEKLVLVSKVKNKIKRSRRKITTAKPRTFISSYNRPTQTLFLDINSIRFAKALPGLTLSIVDPKNKTIPINKIRSTPDVKVKISTRLPRDIANDVFTYLGSTRKPKIKQRPVSKPQQKPIQKPGQDQKPAQDQQQKPQQQLKRKLRKVRKKRVIPKKTIKKVKPKFKVEDKRVKRVKKVVKKKKKVKKKRKFTLTLGGKRKKAVKGRTKKRFTGLEERRRRLKSKKRTKRRKK